MSHIINLYNRDTITRSNIKVGTMTLRHSTGEGYVVIESGGVIKEVPIKGEASRKFIDFVNKNKIVTSIPSTVTELNNRTNVYVDSATDIPETMPIVSVSNILVERDYTNAAEWSGLAEVSEMRLKKLSFTTLGKDVEVEDYRLNEDTGTSMGVTDVESLLNAMLDIKLDLDDVFDKSKSNYSLAMDANLSATDKLTLALNVMDNPMTETDETKFDNKVLSGAAGLQIKKAFEDRIAGLKIFNKVKVTTTDANSITTEKSIEASSNASTIQFASKEADGIVLTVEDNKLVVRHSLLGNVTTNVAYQSGKVMCIGAITTDDKGHITAIGLKDLNDEIAELYYNKTTTDSKYIKKVNTGTETLAGSLLVSKNVTITKDLYVGRNIYVAGENANITTEELTVKDNILEIGTGNTSTLQYTGLKMVKSTSTGLDDEGRDAFMLFDKTNKQFVALYGRTSEADPNTVYDITLAPIRAKNFVGNASTATAFKNPVKIQFMGDASGAVEFYGNENAIIAELNVPAATTTSFGTVKMINTIQWEDDTEDLALNDVYSAQLLQPILDSILNNFKVSSNIDLTEDQGSTEYVASSKAVFEVYKKILAFQEKYDADNLAADKALLNQNTHNVSKNCEIEMPIVIDDTVPVTLTGYGYDQASFDSTLSTKTAYLEYWLAEFKLKVTGYTANSYVLNIMPRSTLGALKKIALPIVEFTAVPYTLKSNIQFFITEYANAGIETGAIRAWSAVPYYINKSYNEVSNRAQFLLDGADAEVTPVDKFYNHLDFAGWMSKYNNTGALGSYFTSTSEKQPIELYGSFTNIVRVATNNSPFRLTPLDDRMTLPCLQLGEQYDAGDGSAVQYSTGCRIGIPGIDTKSAAAALQPYVFIVYFKFTDRGTGSLNFNIEETHVSKTALGIFRGGSSVTYNRSIVSLSPVQISTLVTGRWYCAIGFINTPKSSYTDTVNQYAGIYDVNDTDNSVGYKKISISNASFPTIGNLTNTTGYKFSIGKSKDIGVDICYTPILTRFDTDGILAVKAALSDTRSYNNLYYDYENGLTNNFQSGVFSYIDASKDASGNPTGCYTIDIIAPNSSTFEPNDDLILPTSTNFGIDVDDVTTLVEASTTESTDGLRYTIQNDKQISIASQVNSTSVQKILNKTATGIDIWSTTNPVPNVVILADTYFVPNLKTLIHVLHDNTLLGELNGTAMTYKWNGSAWIALADMFTSIRWLSDLQTYSALNYYRTKTVGQYVTVTVDGSSEAVAAGLSGLQTWYYYTNEGGTSRWKIMGKYTPMAQLDYTGEYTPPVNAAAAITLITENITIADYSSSARFVTLNFASGVTHWFMIYAGEVTHLGEYKGYNLLGGFYTSSDMATFIKDPVKNDAVKILNDSTKGGVQTWYKYNGTSWVYINTYLDFEQKCQSYTTMTINNVDDLLQYYTAPSEGSYAHVGSNIETDTYYQYVAGNWVYRGLKSSYVGSLPYKDLTGTLQIGGTLKINLEVMYSYVNNYTLT